jgi:hypothetical protein
MSAISLNKKKKICCLLSPLLFIYAKLINLFVVNIGEVEFFEYLRPFFVLNAAYFICFYLLYLFSRKSLIHASLCSVVLIITQFMINDFEYLVIRFLGEIKIIFRFVIYIILSVIPLFILRRMRDVRFESVKLILTSGMSLLLMAIYPVFKYTNTFVASNVRHVKLNSDISKGGDYYVIVLDSYARSDKLRDIYKYDNSDFLGKLRNDDFFIANKSLSNYELTMFSLSSFFNMEYVNNLGSPSYTPMYSLLWSKKMISGGAFFRLMEDSGYKFLTINTGCQFTHIDNSDIVYSPYYENIRFTDIISYPHITNIEYAIFSHTMLTLYFKYHSEFENKGQRRVDIRNGLKALRDTIAIKDKKIVFAHFLCPHPPFVFDRNGNDVDSVDTSVNINASTSVITPLNTGTDINIAAYADQARFISNEIGSIVDELISVNPKCNIIIVSDHGGRSLVDFGDIEKSDLGDAFSNLIAIRLPGVKIDSSYDDLTLVNVFRMIFREKYNEDIPLIENRQIFNFMTKSKPVDVTDRLRANARE